jgi:hypothetical protein
MAQAVESMRPVMGNRSEVGEAASASVSETREIEDEGGIVCVSRDPRDVDFIKRLLVVITGMLLVIVLLSSGVAALLMRKPERIVQQLDAHGNVAQIDGFAIGGKNGVTVKEDTLDSGDMIFLARELARMMHDVDMTRRKEVLQKVVDAMTAGAADQYSIIVTERGILRTQREESWDAKWKEQDFSIDPRDPSNVTIIGKQSVQRTVGGKEKRDEFQYSVRFRMAVDPAGKRDQNMRTGFIVREFEIKPITEPTAR